MFPKRYGCCAVLLSHPLITIMLKRERTIAVEAAMLPMGSNANRYQVDQKELYEYHLEVCSSRLQLRTRGWKEILQCPLCRCQGSHRADVPMPTRSMLGGTVECLRESGRKGRRGYLAALIATTAAGRRFCRFDFSRRTGTVAFCCVK